MPRSGWHSIGHRLTHPATVTLILTVPFLATIIANLPMTWDGAAYFLETVDARSPFAPHGRVANLVIQAPLALAARVTDSFPILRLIFSICNIALTPISLALSWWIVCHHAPRLMIWPLLAVCLVLVPVELYFVAEPVKAQMMMWPLLLTVLTGAAWPHLAVSVIAAVGIATLHPGAIPIFVAVALAAVAVAVSRPDRCLRLSALAAGLGLAAGLRWARGFSSYESGELSWSRHVQQWQASTNPTIWLVLILATTIALLLLAERRLRLPTPVTWLPLGLTMICGALLASWAADSRAWWQQLEFRGPSLVLSLLLAGAAFLDAVLPTRRTFRPHTAPTRASLSTALALVFAVAFTTQAVVFTRVVDELDAAIASWHAGCLPLSSLPRMPHTPLNIWSTRYHAIADQSLTPTTLVASAEHCTTIARTGELPPMYMPALQRVDVSRALAHTQDQVACTMTLGDGWWFFESTPDHMWRWTAGDASFTLTLETAARVQLRGTILSIPSPNLLRIDVDGRPMASVPLPDGRQPLMLELDLPAGESTITLASAEPATTVPGDSRKLAIAWQDPAITIAAFPCDLSDFENHTVP